MHLLTCTVCTYRPVPCAGRLDESLQPLFDAEDGRVRPICLPEAPCAGSRTSEACFPGRNAVLAGWGVKRAGSPDRPNVVHYVRVPVVENEQCLKSYESLGLTVTNQMICAGLKQGGKDTCQVREWRGGG